jgi:hypothetical protein
MQHITISYKFICVSQEAAAAAAAVVIADVNT